MPSDVRYLPELPIGRREPSCLAFSEETGKHRNASQSRGAYVEAPRETLAGGGDTDTNACIVGGLMGALHGEDGIPQPMRGAVLTCDTALGRPRPKFFSTRDAASLADQLTQ